MVFNFPQKSIRLIGYMLLYIPSLVFAQIDPAQQVALHKINQHLEKEQFDIALNSLTDLAEEYGVPSSVALSTQLIPQDLSPEFLQHLLLLRAIAHEGIGEYAEAKNNYLAYLAKTNDAEISQNIRAKMAWLNTEAAKYLARISVENETQFQRFYQGTPDTLSIAVLPFFNQSNQANLGRIGYGIAGFLSGTFALLPQYLSLPLKTVERSELNAALNEISIDRFYAANSNQKNPHILGARFVLSGLLNQGDKSLSATATLLDLKSRCSTTFEAVSATTNDEGIRILQAKLNEAVVDALQKCFITQFKGDRFTYNQAVMPLYIGEFQQLMLYGEALELSMRGNHRRSTKLFEQSGVLIAQQDLQYLQNVRIATQEYQQKNNIQDTQAAQLGNHIATAALGSAGIADETTTPLSDKMGALPAILNPNLQNLLVKIKIPLPIPPIR